MRPGGLIAVRCARNWAAGDGTCGRFPTRENSICRDPQAAGGSACSREGRGAAVPGPVRTGECGWCEMRLDRWPEARSRGDLEAVVTSLGEL